MGFWIEALRNVTWADWVMSLSVAIGSMIFVVLLFLLCGFRIKNGGDE